MCLVVWFCMTLPPFAQCFPYNDETVVARQSHLPRQSLNMEWEKIFPPFQTIPTFQSVSFVCITFNDFSTANSGLYKWKKKIQSCFRTWSSALHALGGSSTHTHTHTWWQMVGLCVAPKQPWISYKTTKMLPMTDCYSELKSIRNI